MPDSKPEDDRKPWIIPALTGAIEPDDVANSYLTHQDINPHAANDANAVS